MKIDRIGLAGLDRCIPVVLEAVSSKAFTVTAWDPSRETLKRVEEAFLQSLKTKVEAGSLSEEEREARVARVVFSDNIDQLSTADLVLESAGEDESLKRERLKAVSDVIAEGAIVAINTGCLSVSELAGTIKQPQRVVGMHVIESPRGDLFFEIVRGEASSETSIEQSISFCEELEKAYVVAKDSPGFIVNRLFVPYMNQALESFDHGLATREDLDTAIRMGLGYPDGPLKLIDRIGLDDYLNLSRVLSRQLADTRFTPPSILPRMVAADKLGKKSGEGFYIYDPDDSQ